MLATKISETLPTAFVLNFNIEHTSTEQEMNMLPTTLDEVGSKRSKDLQVESGSYITLYTRETTNLSTNYFIIHLSFKALPKKFPSTNGGQV